MLSSLHIENIAVIRSLDVDFSKGFTVLTGETGAGKSIIIDSIGLILGSRTSKELIRTGENSAMVSALFTDLPDRTVQALSDLGVAPDEDGCLYLQRTIYRDGRSATKLCGRSIPLSMQREVGALLVNTHGQHENQALLSQSSHLGILDRYGKCQELADAYRAEYRKMNDARNKMESILRDEREKQQKLDMLRFQISDIESAKLKSGEEENLTAEKKLLQNTKLLTKQVTTIYRALYKNDKGVSAWRMLEIARKSLEELLDVFPEASEYSDKLYDMQYELASIAEAASDLLPSGGENPEKRLSEIEDRLDTVRRLERKYGSSIDEVLAFLECAKKEQEEILLSDEKAKEYGALYEKYRADATELAQKLSEIRKSAAAALSERICSELIYLDMNKVAFACKVARRNQDGGDALGKDGLDDVEFLISTNPGEPLKPLAKIASGGELSRIMLAIKCVLTDCEGIPTIIFDEIDTGVSGKTSQKIGIKLRELAKGPQVFCITHSAQVAANADTHFKITKGEEGGRSVTHLNLLSDIQRAEELSRIMGGVEKSKAIYESALEMLRNANKSTESENPGSEK